MTERPIFFAAPMVRAILAGTKTQTRRVCKAATDEDGTEFRDADGWPMRDDSGCGEVRAACPYGAPGDRLWVREAFMHVPADYCWEASVSIPCRPALTVYRADHDERESRGAGWTPSIHMPRSLSRITLEITGVMVERLQAIKGEDVLAEGSAFPDAAGASPEQLHARWQPFRDLWESINGPGSWDANPWVWAISFRRLP